MLKINSGKTGREEFFNCYHILIELETLKLKQNRIDKREYMCKYSGSWIGDERKFEQGTSNTWDGKIDFIWKTMQTIVITNFLRLREESRRV